MKKYILIAVLLIGLPLFNFSQSMDSASIRKIIKDENRSIVAAIENQTKLLKDSVVTVIKNPPNAKLDMSPGLAHFLTFMPILFFLLILFQVYYKLKKDGIPLSSFLIDKDTKIAISKYNTDAVLAITNAKVATANAIKANAAAYASTNTAPPTINTSTDIPILENENEVKPDQSISRLIAFISGITSIALATCIVSFYFYRSFLGEQNINLGNLSTVLFGLGMGVLPYGFNKIAAALR